MKNNTFWSDTMTVLLSDVMQSYIDVPLSIAFNLASNLQKNGYKVSNFEKINHASTNIHERCEIFLEVGADKQLIELIESVLSGNETTFTRHNCVNDPDHIDISYDLNNVSVWK